MDELELFVKTLPQNYLLRRKIKVEAEKKVKKKATKKQCSVALFVAADGLKVGRIDCLGVVRWHIVR